MGVAQSFSFGDASMSDILNALQSNDYDGFCAIVMKHVGNSYSGPQNQGCRSLYYLFEDVYLQRHFQVGGFGVRLSSEWEQEAAKQEALQRQAKTTLIHMMEKWLTTQSVEVKEYIMFSNNQGWGFYFDFLEHANAPADLISHVNAAGYLQVSYDDDNDKNIGKHPNSAKHLVLMLEHNLHACVNAIVSQTEVQHLLSQHVENLDGFFEVLLHEDHTDCALHFLECMKHTFAPKWVGQMLAAVVGNTNHTVAQWLHDCPEFEYFLHWSQFETAHLPHVSFADCALERVLPLKEKFPTLWDGIAHNITVHRICEKSDHADHWVAYTHKNLTSAQRVKGIQNALHAHFVLAQTQREYHHSTAASHLEGLTLFAQPLLDTLTTEDVALWNSRGWFLNGVYGVDKHAYFVRDYLNNTLEKDNTSFANRPSKI